MLYANRTENSRSVKSVEEVKLTLKESKNDVWDIADNEIAKLLKKSDHVRDYSMAGQKI